MSAWRRIVVIPDTHVPDHHRKAWSNLLDFIQDFGPDEVLHLGDFIDCPGPARWSKGLAEEYAGTLQAELDLARSCLEELREAAGNATITYLAGNHEDRIKNYLRQYAPAFANLRTLRLESLLGLDEFGITLTPQPYKIAPGWVAIHGDKLSAVAGGLSALKMVRDTGLSTVQGHGHRLGIVYRTEDRQRCGVECGHISDQRRASYIRYGHANWQMGFAVLYVNGSQVHPVLVPMKPNGSFQWDTEDYGS